MNDEQIVADLREAALIVNSPTAEPDYTAATEFRRIDIAKSLDRLADEWEQRQAVIDAAVAWRDTVDDDRLCIPDTLLCIAVDAATPPGTEGEG